MAGFRSKKDGSHYPVKGGKPVYPKTRDPWKSFEPKKSCPNGHEDEGISSVLGKPSDFKYSEQFLKNWYTHEDLSTRTRKEWFQEFYEEYGVRPGKKELDDYIKIKSKKK